MKALPFMLMALVPVYGSGPTSNDTAWPDKLPDFLAEGLRQSQDQDKLLVLDFYADWCGPCKLMDRKVLPHPIVQEELNHWVMVKIDKERYPNLAKNFTVTGLPTYLLITPEGEVLEKAVGIQIAHDFAEWLATNRKKSKASN